MYPHSITERHKPPLAPAAFRVAILGHRPNRLGSADPALLSKALSEILDTVRTTVQAVKEREENEGLFAPADTQLWAVTPLAEGCDRYFADEALKLHYDLMCVLPFSVTEYEQDFEQYSPAADYALRKTLAPDSLNDFRRLLNRAKVTFALDGIKKQAAAYAAGGRVVLNQADLLAVVWDGERHGLKGGTEDTLREALNRNLPVVWIDAHTPHHWKMVETSDVEAILADEKSVKRCAPRPGNDPATLAEIVRGLVNLPTKSAHSESKHGSHEDPRREVRCFYDERKPSKNPWIAWRLFRKSIQNGKTADADWDMKVKDFEADVEKDWPVAGPNASASEKMIDRLRPYYAWADKLSVLYGDRYRSVFVLGFLFSALAVFAALFPILFHEPPHTLIVVCAISETVLIGSVMVAVLMGRVNRWHERWLDYRIAAELVRHLRLIAPLGGNRPFPQLPAHWTAYGQPSASWMAWYVRAIERKMGLPDMAVSTATLQLGLKQMGGLVVGQIRYHKSNAKLYHLIEHRLHYFGIGLLTLTLLCSVAHWLPCPECVGHFAHHYGMYLTLMCGFFPALGAAMAGIVTQAECSRIAKRSKAMAENLKSLLGELNRLKRELKAQPAKAVQYSTPVLALSARATGIFVSEVLDWRVVFQDRPLNPPG